MARAFSCPSLAKPQGTAQAPLAAFHLAAIGFVIIAHQVKRAVKHQDANLITQGAAKFFRVAPRDSRSNGDITQIGVGKGDGQAVVGRVGFPTPASLMIGREGKNIGRVRFASIRAIPASDFGVAHETYRKGLTGQAQRAAGAGEKKSELADPNPYAALTVKDYRTGRERAGQFPLSIGVG
jgi:hypothetical protein